MFVPQVERDRPLDVRYTWVAGEAAGVGSQAGVSVRGARTAALLEAE
jgi:hypothetical protein